MQQELNVEIIKNITSIKNDTDIYILLKKPKVKLLIICIVGFLLARANLFLNINDKRSFAPFGLAYIMAIFVQDKRNDYIVTLLGVLAGYVSIQGQIVELYPYIISIIIVSLIYFCISNNIKRIFKYINVLIVLTSFILCGTFIYKYEFSVNLILSCIQLLMILLFLLGY